MILNSTQKTLYYGKINITLKELMDKKGVNTYQLVQATNINNKTIKLYRTNNNVSRIDLNILAQICYSLNCKVEDILQFQPPEE